MAGLFLSCRNSLGPVIVVAGLLLSLPAMAHEFYVSICTIKYQTDESRIEFALKVFTDDLEAAIKNMSGEAVLLSEKSDADIKDRLVDEYVRSKVELRIGDSQQALQYLLLIELLHRLGPSDTFVGKGVRQPVCQLQPTGGEAPPPRPTTPPCTHLL